MRTQMQRMQPVWIAVMAVVLGWTAAATAQPVVVEEREPTLVVSGRGVVFAPPDRAVVSFGAVAESEEAAAAQVNVNEIMQEAIKAVKREGINDNRLRTSSLTLEPVYETHKSSDGRTYPKIRAYRASYTLTVTVDDLKKVGDVIDAALESGINQFQGLHFTLKDDTDARVEALTAASRDAKVKAEAIAAAMGVRLAGIKRISESGDYYPPPQPMYAGRAMAMKAEMDTPIQSGELTIGANVTVEYLIEPAE